MAREPEIPESASVETNLIFNTPLMARAMSTKELLEFYTLELSGVDILVLQKILRDVIEKAEPVEEEIDRVMYSANTLLNILFQVSELKPDLISGKELEGFIGTAMLGLLARYKTALEKGPQWLAELTKREIEDFLDNIRKRSILNPEFIMNFISFVRGELRKRKFLR